MVGNERFIYFVDIVICMNRVARLREQAELALAKNMKNVFRAVGEVDDMQFPEDGLRFITVCSLSEIKGCGHITVKESVDGKFLCNQFQVHDCRSCMIAIYAPITTLLGIVISNLDSVGDVPVEATEGPLNRESEGLEDVKE